VAADQARLAEVAPVDDTANVLPAGHVGGWLQPPAVPAHVPPLHTSFVVQAFPSLHAVPSAAAGFEHVPVLALHVPARWHWSLAVHVTGLPPVHVPLWHVSVCVHALPSLHEVPSAAAGLEHCPVLMSQVPAT
jgi:hypothetical protein